MLILVGIKADFSDHIFIEGLADEISVEGDVCSTRSTFAMNHVDAMVTSVWSALFGLHDES